MCGEVEDFDKAVIRLVKAAVGRCSPLHPLVGELGSLLVGEAAPGFGSFAGVAVSAEADPIHHAVFSATNLRDPVVELEVNLAQILRVAVRVSAASALPAPQGLAQLVVGDALHVLSARWLAGVCRDEIKQGQACG